MFFCYAPNMKDSKRYYFDHAAATPVLPEVLNSMERFWSLDYGNASAIHQEGLRARSAIESARESIADTLGVSSSGITFTSSATESIHLALVGVVHAWKRDHPSAVPEIITSSIEHDAVLASVRQLEAEGAIVHYLPVNEKGIVKVSELAPLLCDNTVIVSCMLVNNEIGTIQPIDEVARVLRRWKKENKDVTRDRALAAEDMYPLLHTDATQAVNYIELNIPRLGVDMLSCNASKIYGPKGVGLLYRKQIIPLSPVILGGGQESGLRGGTESVPLIVGFAKAFTLAQESALSESDRLRSLQQKLFTSIAQVAGEKSVVCHINGDLENRSPNNVHISFENVDHEYLAILLDDEGFAVSTKSACNMLEAEISHVLVAIKSSIEDEDSRVCQLESGIRLTLGRSTDDIACDAFISALRDVLPLAVLE
jgi:cysteine desulfurase